MATSTTSRATTSTWRNRITVSGEEAPDQLLANPANWRIHPKAQQARRGDDRPRVRGESYKAEVYEAAIGRAIEHVAASARLKTDTVALARRPEPDGGEVLATARTRKERDRAALQFARDRDLGRLEATMARLDAEAGAAVVRPSRIPTAAEAPRLPRVASA